MRGADLREWQFELIPSYHMRRQVVPHICWTFHKTCVCCRYISYLLAHFDCFSVKEAVEQFLWWSRRKNTICRCNSTDWSSCEVLRGVKLFICDGVTELITDFLVLHHRNGACVVSNGTAG